MIYSRLQAALVASVTLVSAGCAAPSGACTSKPALPSGLTPGGPTQNFTITSHGVPRSYLLHLPSGYKAGTPAPLYFSFSGATKDAKEQEGLSSFSDPYFNKNGIAVYPQSIHDFHWLSNPTVPTTTPNDIDFVLDVLAHLEDSFCIDTNRVYAAGKSNGGGLTNLLACNTTSSAKFAAFASVSGAYYEDDLATTDCKPARGTIPFLEFHGLNDTTVPYEGKNGSDPKNLTQAEPPIPTFLSQWVDRNGCTGSQKNATTDPGLFPQGLVDRLRWSCGKGKENVVVHYREKELGHVWPATISNDDCVQHSQQCTMGHYTFNATSVILEFFGNWTLPEK